MNILTYRLSTPNDLYIFLDQHREISDAEIHLLISGINPSIHDALAFYDIIKMFEGMPIKIYVTMSVNGEGLAILSAVPSDCRFLSKSAFISLRLDDFLGHNQISNLDITCAAYEYITDNFLNILSANLPMDKETLKKYFDDYAIITGEEASQFNITVWE